MEELLQGLPAAGIWLGAAVVVFFGLVFFFSLINVCRPNELLVFSGRRRRLPDGQYRGFRVERGYGVRTPVFEKVDRISLALMEVPISIRGAYSRGGIALNVDAIANVKVSADEVIVGNAIERFLGRDPNEIRRVAKETLEGHLRGVLARLTPEEVNEDRLKFAEELSVESEQDLSKLGIHLDTLKILHVSDDRKYLDSIGREAIANVIKDAEIAESDAAREAELQEASNQARANVTKAQVEANIARLRNDLRRIQADLEAQVRSEEETTLAAAREARAKAEQDLQQLRAQVEEIRLRADQILPAEAHLVAQEHKARGDAAIIRERGLAMSRALEEMTAAWKEAGDQALSIYLIEDIEKILATAAKGVNKMKIDELSMIDGGDGQVLSAYVAAYPQMLNSVFGAIAQTTGIDIPKAISASSDPAPKEVRP